jgi:hypothetical protein
MHHIIQVCQQKNMVKLRQAKLLNRTRQEDMKVNMKQGGNRRATGPASSRQDFSAGIRFGILSVVCGKASAV